MFDQLISSIIIFCPSTQPINVIKVKLGAEFFYEKFWGSSSVGRASRSQRGGRGFESHLLHQFFAPEQKIGGCRRGRNEATSRIGRFDATTIILAPEQKIGGCPYRFDSLLRMQNESVGTPL